MIKSLGICPSLSRSFADLDHDGVWAQVLMLTRTRSRPNTFQSPPSPWHGRKFDDGLLLEVAVFTTLGLLSANSCSLYGKDWQGITNEVVSDRQADPKPWDLQIFQWLKPWWSPCCFFHSGGHRLSRHGSSCYWLTFVQQFLVWSMSSRSWTCSLTAEVWH